MIYCKSKCNNLIPSIQEALKNLKQNNTSYFTRVLNLNEIIDNKPRQIKVREAIQDADPSINFDFTETIKLLLQKIAYCFIQYDYFLQIEIIDANNQWEFQYYLYEASLGKNQFPYIKVHETLASKSVFIKKGQADYEDQLKLLVSKIFPQVYKRPVAKISCDKNINKEYYIELNKSITFSGENSFVMENMPKKLSYSWQIESFTNGNKKTKGNLSMQKDNTFYKITGEEVGTYSIQLKVFDGIDWSDSDSATLHVCNKPMIKIPCKTHKTIYQRSLFTTQITLTDSICISSSNKKTLDSSKIVFNNSKKTIDTLETNKVSFIHKFLPGLAPDPFTLPAKKQNPIAFTLLKAKNGFNIYYTYDPLVSFKERYYVGVKENNISSDPKKLKIKHSAYSCLSLALYYQKNQLSLNNNSLYDTILVRSNLRSGIAIHLASLNGFEIESDATIGIAINKMSSKSQTYNIPFQATIGIKKSILYAGLSCSMLSQRNISTVRNLDFLTGYLFGIAVKPNQYLPIHLNITFGFSFKKKVFGEYESSQRFTSFGTKLPFIS